MSALASEINAVGVLQLVMSGVSIIVSGTIGVVVLVTGRGQRSLQASVDALNLAESRRREDLASAETRRSAEVAAIQTQLHTATEKLIDERFSKISHSVNNHAQSFTAALDKMALHVSERDEAFARVQEPKNELHLLKAMNELRDEVRDSTVTKSDFNDLREEHREMQKQLNKIPMIEDLRKLLQEAR